MKAWKKAAIANYTRALYKAWNARYSHTPAMIFDEDEALDFFKIPDTNRTIKVEGYFRTDNDSVRLVLYVRTIPADYVRTGNQLVSELPEVRFCSSNSIQPDPITEEEMGPIVDPIVAAAYAANWVH